DLYQFSDGLFVVGGIGPADALAGWRVEQVGTRTPEEALELVTPLITRDNPVGIRWNGPYFMTYPALVRRLGTDSLSPAGQTRLMLRDPAGRRVDTTLSGGEIRPPAKLTAPKRAPGRPPLYLERPDENFWLRALPQSSTLYVQYNQVQ